MQSSAPGTAVKKNTPDVHARVWPPSGWLRPPRTKANLVPHTGHLCPVGFPLAELQFCLRFPPASGAGSGSLWCPQQAEAGPPMASPQSRSLVKQTRRLQMMLVLVGAQEAPAPQTAATRGQNLVLVMGLTGESFHSLHIYCRGCWPSELGCRKTPTGWLVSLLGMGCCSQAGQLGPRGLQLQRWGAGCWGPRGQKHRPGGSAWSGAPPRWTAGAGYTGRPGRAGLGTAPAQQKTASAHLLGGRDQTGNQYRQSCGPQGAFCMCPRCRW